MTPGDLEPLAPLRSVRCLRPGAFLLRRGRALRLSLRERPEQLESRRLEIAGEPAPRQQLPALGGDRRSLQRLQDAVESGLAAAACLGEDPACRAAKARQRLVLRLPRLVEPRTVFPCQNALLGLAQPVAGVEEQVDVTAIPPGELVDCPCRDGRLAQALELLGLVAPAGVPQLAGEPVPFSDELGRVEPVQVVELVVEGVYSGSSTREVVP